MNYRPLLKLTIWVITQVNALINTLKNILHLVSLFDIFIDGFFNNMFFHQHVRLADYLPWDSFLRALLFTYLIQPLLFRIRILLDLLIICSRYKFGLLGGVFLLIHERP